MKYELTDYLHTVLLREVDLKEILFEKLEISTEGISKTKTGISTAAAELDKLKDKGFDENTLAIFTSDHGDILGSHGRWQN